MHSATLAIESFHLEEFRASINQNALKHLPAYSVTESVISNNRLIINLSSHIVYFDPTEILQGPLHYGWRL